MKILFTIRSLQEVEPKELFRFYLAYWLMLAKTFILLHIKRQRETILFQKRYRYMKCHNERIVQ